MATDMAQSARWVKGWTARLRRLALDALFPPVCPITDEPVARAGMIAPGAWSQIAFIDDPACRRCGVPFPFDPGGETECAACVADPPAYDRARAAVVYDETSKRLVLALKHGSRTDAVNTMAAWLVRIGGETLTGSNAVIPVPLHPSRLRMRRFNQAALLAKAVAETASIPFEPDVLMRRRRTDSQEGRSAKGRKRNVAGAFAVRSDMRQRVAGGSYVIVDDVHTTGATLNACAKALKRAGAARVEALTVARVVRPRDAMT